MKIVNIYVCGTYEYASRIGTWTYYLEYNGAVKKQSAQAGNMKSHVQTTLIALVKALESLNQACNLIIHSKQPLGFNSLTKSANKELLVKILNMMTSVGHIASFDSNNNFEQVQLWEKLYGNNKEEIQKQKRKEQQQSRKEQKEEEKQFEKMARQSEEDWKAMYSDLMGPSQGCWVPGSGGY